MESNGSCRICSIFSSYNAVKLYTAGEMKGWARLAGQDTAHVILGLYTLHFEMYILYFAKSHAKSNLISIIFPL